MDFPDHPQRERLTFGQEPQAMLHGIDIAGNLRYILTQGSGSAVDFMTEQVGKRRLGALDLRGEDGFFPDVSVEEKPGIRQE